MLSHGTRQRNSLVSDDAEALQTDVMRFLAIICMCLMIVFSLVQSLPVSETENRPRMQDKKMLEKDIQVLEEKADQLRQILIVFETDIIQKQKHVEQSSAQIKERQEKAVELDTITRKKQEELERKQRLLTATASLVKSARNKEQEYKKMAKKAMEELMSKQSDIEKTSQLISKGRQKLKQMESDITIVKNKSEHKKNIPEPVKKEEKEGFTLGFVSNDTLMQLLNHGQQVELFILSGKKSWKLEIKPSGDLVFFPSSSPKKIYEMDRRTVPEKIIRASRRAVAAFGKGSVTYGVVLTPDITNQFGKLMNGKKGGDLVIYEKGKVVLE